MSPLLFLDIVHCVNNKLLDTQTISYCFSCCAWESTCFIIRLNEISNSCISLIRVFKASVTAHGFRISPSFKTWMCLSALHFWSKDEVFTLQGCLEQYMSIFIIIIPNSERLYLIPVFKDSDYLYKKLEAS